MSVLLLAGFVLARDPVPPAAKPVAMVLTWSGSPTWSDGKTTRPLRSYDRLRPGEVVSAGPGGTVLLYFPEDGHKELLHADASVVLQAKNGKATGKVEVIDSKLNAENRDALREAIGTGKIGGTVLRNGKLDVLDPAIVPVSEAIVVTDRPLLRWPAVKDAANYRVTLQNAGSGKTVWVKEVATPELKYPDDKPLTRERKYKWSVTAVFANKDEKQHLKERTFTVGTEGMAKQAAVWKELADRDDPAGQMLAAIGYEQLGMFDELYPLYAKITQKVTDDAKLWVIYATYAAKAGLQKESDDAYQKAKKLGWREEP